ncbi:MAG TPA: PspC domain-containing protein [Actinomycetota bacterium]|nr:PspC domain-containing protein [Actinomycetota bacterium]
MSEPRPAERRVLRRSRADRVIAGVCGGLGRYLGIEPVMLRIAFVLLLVTGGAGFLLYLVAWIAIPEEAEGEDLGPAPERRGDLWWFVGVGLIALGGVLLIDRLVPWFDRVIAPLILVAIGVAVLYRGTRR